MRRLAIGTALVLVVVTATGDVLTVTFPATGTGQQQNTTVVTLKRLSGIDQMLPQ